MALAHKNSRGETEDLGRFNFDFNFPSPKAPSVEDPAEGPTQGEGFELSAMDDANIQQDTEDIDVGPASSDDDDDAGNAGDFGLELNMTPEPSDGIRSESPGSGPGIIGGGLRDDHYSEPGKKGKMLSRHGIPVPAIPSGVVRKVAGRFSRVRAGSKGKINKATLGAIEQASSWFFEQMSEDLGTYSKHAGRKTIDESDVMTLMRR